MISAFNTASASLQQHLRGVNQGAQNINSHFADRQEVSVRGVDNVESRSDSAGHTESERTTISDRTPIDDVEQESRSFEQDVVDHQQNQRAVDASVAVLKVTDKNIGILLDTFG
jgi:hypothetical protein